MNLKESIKKLSLLSGISGFESNVSQYLIDNYSHIFDDCFIDTMGNFIACKKSKSGFGSVMIEAHIDEIGLMVRYIDENGYLLIDPVGGIDSRILPGSEVTVHGKTDCKGIIFSSEKQSETPTFDLLYVDIGLNKEEVSEIVDIGTPISLVPSFTDLQDGYISSKCLDDRACVAILLDCIEKLKDADLGYDLYLCACVQEEVGLRGSLTAAYTVNPDLAIAVDVTHASTPDEKNGTFKCGCGPVICRGPNLHSILTSKFIEVMEKNKINYEIEVEPGDTGTDAWSIQTAREGIPTILLSLPIKYMHTPIETAMMSDCSQTSEAICDFLKSFERTEDILC